VHLPVAGWQTPGSKQAAGGSQLTGVPAVQTPCWQVDTPLQRLPSSQLALSTAFGLVQDCVAGLQTPGMWQGLSAVHAAMHLPPQSWAVLPAGAAGPQP
jgi:hypothetical protein